MKLLHYDDISVRRRPCDIRVTDADASGAGYARTVPTYVFRCSSPSCRTGGTFEQHHPMATVPDAAPCTSCGEPATRTVTSPALGRGNSSIVKAHDAARASAESPAVVSSLPGRGRAGTPTTSNPLHRKLPRP